MREFHIEKGWESRLQELGIDSLEKMLAFRSEGFTSVHRRGATYKIPLPGEENEHLFLKCDYFTYKKEIIKDFFCGKKPAQNSVKERIAFDYARNAGFIVPDVIAWGQMTAWGLPSKAAMLMREIHGTNLEELIRSGQEKDFVSQAEGLLRKMFGCGFDWPDYKPEHFIVMPDGKVALIDLERMRFVGDPLSEEQVASRLERFHGLVEAIKDKR